MSKTDLENTLEDILFVTGSIEDEISNKTLVIKEKLIIAEKLITGEIKTKKVIDVGLYLKKLEKELKELKKTFDNHTKQLLLK